MSNQPPRVYTGITPERFDELSELAASKGLHLAKTFGAINVTGGEVMFHNCIFRWSLNQQTAELTIECTAHPFYIELKAIYEKLDELLKI